MYMCTYYRWISPGLYNKIGKSGEQVIRTEQLTERESTEIALPYGTEGSGRDQCDDRCRFVR